MRSGVSVMKAKVVEGKEEAGAKFSDYFSHSEKWANIPSHRMLAMLRARNEGVISLDIETDAAPYGALAEGEGHGRSNPVSAIPRTALREKRECPDPLDARGGRPAAKAVQDRKFSS